MQMHRRYLNLQIFADGGEGGAGDGATATGVTGMDTASPQPTREERLAALGVPADKIRTRQSAQTAQAEEAPSLASSEPQQTEETAPAKASWDELMADPDYNKRMQETVSQRVKKYKGDADNYGKLQGVLSTLASYYGKDEGDLDGLIESFNSDNHYYENKAVEMGIPVETARRLTQLEQQEAQRRQQDEQNAQNQMISNHLMGLQRQAEELQQTFPNFDLRAELQNETFRRLTSPSVNIPVKDAYYAVHREEIQNAQNAAMARQLSRNMSNAIQSGRSRPVENGSSSTAPSVGTPSYAHMSRDQRESLKARIRRGERIVPK